METISYCYELGNEYAGSAHMRLLYDCAQLCATLQDTATLHSPSSIPMSLVVAEVCKRCAKSCESFKGDRPMEKCGRVCRSCADACSALASGKIIME